MASAMGTPTSASRAGGGRHRERLEARRDMAETVTRQQARGGVGSTVFVAVFIAGIPVRVALVLELAGLVDDEELASKLRRAVENETRVLATDDGERDELLLALVEPPEGLAELRGVLMRERRVA